MALEALWAVTFISNVNPIGGGGVVVFETQRVFGGDATYYYVGSYNVTGDDMTADVAIIHHAGPLNNIFGPLARVDLTVKGKWDGQSKSIQAEGAIVQDPSLKVWIKFKHLQDLP